MEYTRLPDGTWVLNTLLAGRNAKTIQTHNAVSVPANGGQSISPSWINCDGYDKVSITMTIDATATNYGAVLWSNDGVSSHGEEVVATSKSTNRNQGITDVKAKYVKIYVINSDAAAAHTMSVWVYLKT